MKVTEWAIEKSEAGDGRGTGLGGEPSLSHLRNRQAKVEGSVKSREGFREKDQGGNTAVQVLGPVVGWWKAPVASAEGTKEKRSKQN